MKRNSNRIELHDVELDYSKRDEIESYLDNRNLTCRRFFYTQSLILILTICLFLACIYFYLAKINVSYLEKLECEYHINICRNKSYGYVVKLAGKHKEFKCAESSKSIKNSENANVIFDKAEFCSGLNKNNLILSLETGIYDEKAKLRDIFEETLLKTLKIDNNEQVTAFAYNENGYLASGSSGGTIQIWNLNNGSLKKKLTSHTYRITGLAYVNINNLASASFVKIIIWDVSTGRINRTLENSIDFINALVYVQNGYLASGGKKIKLWDAKTEYKNPIELSEGYVSALIYLNKNYLASAVWHYTIKIWDVNRQSLVRELIGHSNTVISLAYVENGYLATASEDNKIKLWQDYDEKLIITLKEDSDMLSRLAFINREYLTSGHKDGKIRIWNVNERKLIKTLEGNSSNITALVYLKNLKSGYLVSGSLDGTIKIWR